MPVEVNDLIQEYYEKESAMIAEKYGISLDECKTICKAPFIYFRKMMESPELPIINIKFFGKFLIFPGAAKKIIEGLKKRLNLGEITEEQFNSRTVNLKAHINDYETKNPVDCDREETPD